MLHKRKYFILLTNILTYVSTIESTITCSLPYATTNQTTWPACKMLFSSVVDILNTFSPLNFFHWTDCQLCWVHCYGFLISIEVIKIITYGVYIHIAWMESYLLAHFNITRQMKTINKYYKLMNTSLFLDHTQSKSSVFLNTLGQFISPFFICLNFARYLPSACVMRSI